MVNFLRFLISVITLIIRIIIYPVREKHSLTEALKSQNQASRFYMTNHTTFHEHQALAMSVSSSRPSEYSESVIPSNVNP